MSGGVDLWLARCEKAHTTMRKSLDRRTVGRPPGHHVETVRWALAVSRVAARLPGFVPRRSVVSALELALGKPHQHVHQLLAIAECARGTPCPACRAKR